MTVIASPCVKTCVLDPLCGICIGCGRTGAEIAGWLGYSASERQSVMAQLPERLRRLTSERPRRGGRRARVAETRE